MKVVRQLFTFYGTFFRFRVLIISKIPLKSLKKKNIFIKIYDPLKNSHLGQIQITFNIDQLFVFVDGHFVTNGQSLHVQAMLFASVTIVSEAFGKRIIVDFQLGYL